MEDLLNGKTRINVKYFPNDDDNTASKRISTSGTREPKQKLFLTRTSGPQYGSKALVPVNINAFRAKFKKPRDNSVLWARIRERNSALSI